MNSLTEDFIVCRDVTNDDGISKYSQMMWYLDARRQIATGIYVTAIIVGVFLKLVTIYLTLRHKLRATSAANCLIVSLMVAGLLHLLFVVPMNIVETVRKGWHFSEIFCQVHRYIWFVCLYAIAYHLVVILLYLFLGLVRPQWNPTLDKPMVAIGVVTSIWILILTTNSANLVNHGIMDNIPGLSYCYPKHIYRKGLDSVQSWMLASFVTMYLAPVLFMLFLTILIWWNICTRNESAYGRLDEDERARIRWDFCLTASIISGLFLLCWSPRLIHAMQFAFSYEYSFGFQDLLASDMYAMLLHAIFPMLVPCMFLLCFRDFRRSICGCFTTFTHVVPERAQILENENEGDSLDESGTDREL